MSTTSTITWNNLAFIDLTAMYGSGNEPTIEQFEAMFPADYYPYNTGELLNVNADGIKATDPVLGESTADISSWQNLKDPSDPSKPLFPYGLCSVGNVRDEITATQAIKRITCVDVGSLSFASRDLTNNRKAIYADPPLPLWAPSDSAILGHISCPKFNLVTQNATWAIGDMSVLAAITTWSVGGNLAFTVSPDTTINQFKTANAGVLLVGELATPIVVDLPRRQDYSYPVSLSTTESVVPDNALLSVGWNQRLDKIVDTFTTSSGCSIVNGKTIFVWDSSYSASANLYFIQNDNINIVQNHIYYISADMEVDWKGGTPVAYGIRLGATTHATGSIEVNGFNNRKSIIQSAQTTAPNTYQRYIRLLFAMSDMPQVRSGATFTLNYAKVIDLTQLFGTDEQIAAALGVSVSDVTSQAAVDAFERMFPADYYPYNAGQQLYLYPSQQYYSIPASPSVGETKPYTAPVITTNDYGIAVSEYLPNGYRRLEWIASTGAQYINSNVIPTYLTELELKFKCTNNFATGAASRWTGSPEYDTFGLFASPTSHKLISYFGRYSEGLYNGSDATYDAGTEIVYGLYQDKIVINQSIINITRSDIGFENAIPIYLLAQNNTDTVGTYNATTRMYYARLYDNGRLLRNFIPCINSNSDIGMYDTITHAFFGNAGTGDFIAGPIIG